MGSTCWLYAALVVVLTWPLTTRITTHLPISAESSPTVPLFNLAGACQWSLIETATLPARLASAPEPAPV